QGVMRFRRIGMKARFRIAAVAALCVAELGLACSAGAQDASHSLSDGVYSKAQAARGKALYESKCASCHGGSLAGADTAPPLAGSAFLGNWKGQTASDLATRIRTTMPQNDPGSLGTAAVADIMAYMFSGNGFPAGS